MKSLLTVVSFCLFTGIAFSQSSAQSQPAKKSDAKQSNQASTSTNNNKSGSANRVTGTTWYYCTLCGQKYSAPGKCPADKTTLVAKTIK